MQGTIGGDFNLAVWQFWLQTPNLMYTSTSHIHTYLIMSISQSMYTQYYPICQTKCLPICITF